MVVDDEPDVLATIADLLVDYDLVCVDNAQAAETELKKGDIDIAILDIMGVDGYKLLEIAVERDILAVMLTAQALTPEDTVKSFRGGAAYFIPKDEMADIETILLEMLETRAKNKNPLKHWLERFRPFYDKKFGPDWQERDQEFWDRFVEKYGYW